MAFAIAIPLGAKAAGVESPSPGSQEFATPAVQRAHIETQLRQLDARYLQQQQACESRFFVNDCLDRVRANHHTATQTLQSELHAIDLADRERRAAEERRRVENNLREHQVPNAAAARRERARREQQLAERQREHEKRLAEAGVGVSRQPGEAAPQATSRNSPSVSVTPGRGEQKPPTLDAHRAEKARAAYARKLAEYRRRQVEAAQRDRTAESSTPALPIPDGY